MKIKISELEKTITKVLCIEYSKEEAKLMKDIVMFGELSGRKLRSIREENLERGEVDVNEKIFDKILKY